MAQAEPNNPPKLPIWALWVLFTLYILPGLIDHDPWRGDDAEHFSVIFQMLGGGDWLVPGVAGRLQLDYPPLYYWIGAALGKALGWLMPLHNAARLASGFCVGLTLFCLARAARLFYGDRADRAAVLLGLGTLGLLTHSHEFQPQLALLACSAATLLGFAEFLASPRRGAVIAGVAIGCAFLAAGLPALMLLMPLWILLPGLCNECRQPNRLRSLALGAGIALAIVAAWISLLGIARPAALPLWWHATVAQMTPHADHIDRIDSLTQLIAWFMWPLWPLAGWALWRARRQLTQTNVLLPLAAFLLALMLVTFTGPLRPAQALPLLPPLVMLASSGVQTLRRGAASGFDWFGRMIFAASASFVWLAWCALHFRWPAPLARNIARLVPGYTPELSVPGLVIATLLSLLWLGMMARPPRSPIRGTLSWAAGVTFLWVLVVTLFLPVIDYDKSYRRLAGELVHELPGQETGCIAEIGMGPSQWGSLLYFENLRFETVLKKKRAPECDWLVVYASRNQVVEVPAGWRPVWEGRRGRSRSAEQFVLYRRDETGSQ